MARNSVLVRYRPTMSLGFRPAGVRAATLVGLVLAWAPCALGAGIFRGLTAQDRSQPIVLSQAGAAISLRSPVLPGAAIPPGTVPAYLAFSLHGGEHFPSGTPTVDAGPRPGETPVGPLDLTPTTRASLNADLMASKGAIVSTPDRSYAIAFLPRYARALAHATSSASTGSGGAAPTIGIGSILGLNAPAASWTINGVPASKLSQWFQTGTRELTHLTTIGLDGVSKTFGIKVTPTSAGYHIAAQELIPPTSLSPGGRTLAVPAPEPGAWLVFGLILGASALRRRRLGAD